VNPFKTSGFKNEPKIALCGNRNGQHNTEQKSVKTCN